MASAPQPPVDVDLTTASGDERKAASVAEESGPDRKKRRLAPCSDIKLFATDSDVAQRGSDPNHWSRSQCWTLREVLGYDGNQSATVDFLIAFNYIVNVEYLLAEIPELLSIPRVVFFYGSADTPFEPWQSAAAASSTDFVRLDPSAPPGPFNPTAQTIPFGVHHTKMFLVGFSDDRLRVIIHTSNLRHNDVHVKAQGAFIQDFSLKASTTTRECAFETDLIRYLDTYQYHKRQVYRSGTDAETMIDCIRRYDFSSARAILIPSTPGYHNPATPRLGHLKLQQAVADHTTRDHDGGPIICQFSSMGSLTEKYLNELQAAMDVRRSTRPLRLQLVYPTVEEVRTSVEGYRGGGSVPGPFKNVSKPFLRPLYRKWSSSTDQHLGKGKNIPHIKTYYQLTSDLKSFHWFVLSSHNLSKAAWGEVVNSRRYSGRRLFIRHWELGVFVSPSVLQSESLCPWSTDVDDSATIPVPFAIVPEPYGADDAPWAVDQRYSKADMFGRFFVSDGV